MANTKKKCRLCKTYRPIAEMRIVQLGAFCIETSCNALYGIEQARVALDKARANINKEKKEKIKTEKLAAKNDNKAARDLKRKDLGWQHEKTQAVFNRMRVLQEKLWFQDRGLEPECISCGRSNMDWCCGHFKTRGSFPELRYSEKNTFLQCNFHCNKSLSGNIGGDKHSEGYLKGLVSRFGEVEGQQIIDYCDIRHEPQKWEWQELEKFRAVCSQQIRELEKLL